MSGADYTSKYFWKVILVVIMFPSAAFLSEFECPLYPRGRCSRPFCKYRHVEHAAKGNVSPVTAQGKQAIKYTVSADSVKQFCFDLGYSTVFACWFHDGNVTLYVSRQ